MIRKLSVALLATIVLSTGLAWGQDKKDESKKEDGWISLFDGKTMNGWKPATENSDTWKVEDGSLVTHGKRCHLFYIGSDPDHPAEFKNFDFKADVLTKPGSNSGIYFHTKYQAEGWPDAGYECQVDNSHSDPVRTASLYNVVKNYTPPAPDNKWFTMEISVNGKNIVTKVDGKVIVDYTEPDGTLTLPRKLSAGTFALQGHDPGSQVFFKNIYVRPKK